MSVLPAVCNALGMDVDQSKIKYLEDEVRDAEKVLRDLEKQYDGNKRNYESYKRDADDEKSDKAYKKKLRDAAASAKRAMEDYAQWIKEAKSELNEHKGRLQYYKSKG